MNDLIFGHTWEDIQAMQQKRHIPKLVSNKPAPPDLATEKDRADLERYGLEKLKEMQYCGTLERLKNSNLI